MGEDLEALAAKLRQLSMQDAETVSLSTDEIKSVRRALATFEMIESWGKLGKFLLWAITAVAGAMIAWETVMQRLGK